MMSADIKETPDMKMYRNMYIDHKSQVYNMSATQEYSIYTGRITRICYAMYRFRYNKPIEMYGCIISPSPARPPIENDQAWPPS